ncbi:MAG: sulfotransferase [Armatimonadota bacterium]
MKLLDLLEPPATRATSLLGTLRHRQLFPQVEQVCLFIGYPRSGHSLVGSLLNAHRHAVIAHELDLMQYVLRGYHRDGLYALMMERDRWFERIGRNWSRYDYRVPNQWQGRVERLRVIGDKKGSGTTAHLQQHPHLLDQLRKTVGVPIRFVHVARNPFDNVSTMYSKRPESRTLEKSVRKYFRKCEWNAELLAGIPEGEAHSMRLEELIADPKRQLAELCQFVGLDAPEDYLRDCASMVFEKPRRTREKVTWPPELIREVEEQCERFPFLKGYRWDN